MDVGGLMFFYDLDVTPFLGASAGAHYINLRTRRHRGAVESADGFATAASAFVGYAFLRNTNVRADVRGGYRTAFIGLDGHGAHGVFFATSLTF
ncbi:MAG: hypothetical protein M5R36_25775 [Deltaproteobacteria bacterium]|nr:hypothetical protein [Deltaproteobacteria bacterium]